MDYGTILCICYAGTPFVAMTKEFYRNRRRWFTWLLLLLGIVFAVMVCLTYIFTKASDALCFNYQDVIRRLWQCTGTGTGFDDTCCKRIEGEVSRKCGWTYSRAEFCAQFGEATLEYCRVNYCPLKLLNITEALPLSDEPPALLDS